MAVTKKTAPESPYDCPEQFFSVVYYLLAKFRQYLVFRLLILFRLLRSIHNDLRYAAILLSAGSYFINNKFKIFCTDCI